MSVWLLAVFGDALERLADLPVAAAENQTLADDAPANRRWMRTATLPLAVVKPEKCGARVLHRAWPDLSSYTVWGSLSAAVDAMHRPR